VASYPNRFNKFNETGSSVELVNAPGQITEPGTPFTPENMNHIEEGIFQAHGDIAAETEARETAVANEAYTRQSADNALQNDINAAKTYAEQQVAGEAVERQTAIQNLQAQLDGVQVVQLRGALLTRVINGTTEVAKILFDVPTVFKAGKTLINDTNGTLGVYIEDVDGATIKIETKTVSSIASDEPTLLGNVANFDDLPLTVNDAVNIKGWNTPKIDDYARVLADETNDNKTVEWYIVDITDGNITWGNPVIINTSDFQEQTTAQCSGRVLTGGAAAGTFGQCLGVDLIPDKNSLNLLTSSAVLSANYIDELMKLITMPGKPEHSYITDESILAQFRRMPMDGRTISVNDTRAERLLQYCLIPYSVAVANPNIIGMYLTNEYYADHAAWLAANKTRPEPAENGAFLVIPDGSAMFIRGSGVHGGHKAANDTPYDGKNVGEFLPDGLPALRTQYTMYAGSLSELHNSSSFQTIAYGRNFNIPGNGNGFYQLQHGYTITNQVQPNSLSVLYVITF